MYRIDNLRFNLENVTEAVKGLKDDYNRLKVLEEGVFMGENIQIQKEYLLRRVVYIFNKQPDTQILLGDRDYIKAFVEDKFFFKKDTKGIIKMYTIKDYGEYSEKMGTEDVSKIARVIYNEISKYLEDNRLNMTREQIKEEAERDIDKEIEKIEKLMERLKKEEYKVDHFAIEGSEGNKVYPKNFERLKKAMVVELLKRERFYMGINILGFTGFEVGFELEEVEKEIKVERLRTTSAVIGYKRGGHWGNKNQGIYGLGDTEEIMEYINKVVKETTDYMDFRPEFYEKKEAKEGKRSEYKRIKSVKLEFPNDYN